MYDIVIIGGGASGLAAAIAASNIGEGKQKICILERMDRLGKKLLATGNGRCNITNVSNDIKHYHGNNRKLIHSVTSNFGYIDTITFFEQLGLLCKEDREGRVYPYCMQASVVLDILKNSVLCKGISVKCNFYVNSIIQKHSIFYIKSMDGSEVLAKKVILATGGRASPNLGSDGSGYKIAKDFGHSIIETFPALVQLKSDSIHKKSLDGIRVIGIAKAVINKEIIEQEKGEILFTKYGLSGIPIIQLSHLYGYKPKDTNMSIIIDLMPEFDENYIFKLLNNRRHEEFSKTLETFLVGLLNKRVGYAILKNLNLYPLSRNSSILTDKQLMAITKQMKNFEFLITGDMSWNNAQVTAGGLNTKEFNEESLESLIVKGLYASGELLDVYGDCGGYNLQWAWATGVTCGTYSASTK
ncbi:MAG: aminoacetone oxidase family FAD-binding enzyme [Crenarchaeota archaeon]|nr:aminoacetone oxidase family FAD-binding enzyme [Thermoproteota archaeon]